MNRKFNLLKSLLVSLALILFSGMAVAQNGSGNGAFVDVNKVLQAIPGYSDSIKKLDEVRLMYQNQYNFLLVDLQQKIKTYELKKDSFSPFVSNLKLQEIKQAQGNLDTFQKVANTALKMQQDLMLTGFLTSIHDAVSEIGAQKKISVVWDAAMLKNAIWSDPKSDITEEVIAKVKSKSVAVHTATSSSVKK